MNLDVSVENIKEPNMPLCIKDNVLYACLGDMQIDTPTPSPTRKYNF